MITIQNPFDAATYVYWAGDVCLYVGESQNGLIRPFGRDHKIVKKHRSEVTHIDIYPLKNKAEAKKLQDILTKKFKPKYDKDPHFRRLQSIPSWALDNQKVKELIQLHFKEPQWALRAFQVINLYYRVGSTAGAVAEELKMSNKAVEMMIRRINKSMKNPLKPSHRPKAGLKKGDPIDASNGSSGQGHITL